MSTLASIMIQRFQRSANEVADNCIDDVTPIRSMNLPLGDGSFQSVRFQNTCGNRYCQAKLGFESGRVIEIAADMVTTLECFHSTPPATGNSCEGVLKQNPLVQTVQTSVTEIARECVDPAVPNLNDNMPGVIPERFVDTCGKRFCQNKHFRDGRVVEFRDDTAFVECYSDPGNFFVDSTASVSSIARNCIDDAVPAFENNLPDANQLRFMSTCGDRYCRNVLGQKSGKVVEYYNGIATLTCVKAP